MTPETIAHKKHNIPWPRGVKEHLPAILSDPAVRYGIKFGLAGVLAFAVSQWTRLDTPTWSVITVFVLMMGQYVGAIAEKAFFRMVGTLAGGVVGYLLTGSLQQDPLLYLPLVGLVVGFSTAMFGQSRAPYAFLLFGLTTVVVAGDGMNDPDYSWVVALTRMEEVFVGVIVTLLVSSLLWPRFARQEFFLQTNKEIVRMQEQFDDQSAAFLHGTGVQTKGSGSRLLALRNLLHFGARESSIFRKRLPTYHAVLNALSRVSGALDNMSNSSVLDPYYKPYLAKELEALWKATSRVFGAVATDEESTMQAAMAEAAEASQAMDVAFHRAASEGHSLKFVGTEAALDLGAWILAVEEIHHSLSEVAALIGTLPTKDVIVGKETNAPSTPPMDRTWITNGIRSGVAVIIGLLVENWLHPPGGGMVTLSAWVFTALSRLYPGGEGDRRAFHYTVYTSAFGLLYVVAMLLLTPILSSYAALNTLLFTAMFLFGWLSFSIPGMAFGMQVAMLATVGTLGLDPQHPVTFQQISGVYFGIVLGMLISALVQRFLWPVLPQYQLRKHLLEWIAHCRKQTCHTPTPIPKWVFVRLALLPAETSAWIGVMNKPDCPPGERKNLEAMATTLARLSTHLLKNTPLQEKDLSPENFLLSQKRRSDLIDSIDATLAALEKQIITFQPPLPAIRQTLVDSLDQWTETATQIRKWVAENTTETSQKLRVLANLDHTLKAGSETLLLLDTTSKTDLPRLFCDSIL